MYKLRSRHVASSPHALRRSLGIFRAIPIVAHVPSRLGLAGTDVSLFAEREEKPQVSRRTTRQDTRPAAPNLCISKDEPSTWQKLAAHPPRSPARSIEILD